MVKWRRLTGWRELGNCITLDKENSLRSLSLSTVNFPVLFSSKMLKAQSFCCRRQWQKSFYSIRTAFFIRALYPRALTQVVCILYSGKLPLKPLEQNVCRCKQVLFNFISDVVEETFCNTIPCAIICSLISCYSISFSVISQE